MTKVTHLLFLDFDGVLCNSIDECFVSSWLAFHHNGSEPAAVPLAERRLFDSFRPFIRRGADYLLLQRCIADGTPLRSQADFDRELAEAGEERMAEYDRQFYEVRARLLAEQRSYWLALNRPYARILAPLRTVSARPGAYILSTKRADYIFEIVASWGIAWPKERIVTTGASDKGEHIGRLIHQAQATAGTLIDDQIDHLNRITDGRVRRYLAAWGYVQPAWLVQTEIPIVDEEGFALLLRRFSAEKGDPMPEGSPGSRDPLYP